MRIVLLTQVQSLIDHCTALADGVGVPLDVRSPVSGGWQDSVLVLVGEDVTHIPPTGSVPTVLVGAEGAGDDVWVAAAKLGVDNVVILPAGAEWLTQRMIHAVEPPDLPAPTLGVVGGSGGAGASVLASALARCAADSGINTILVDADPLGGGLDVVLGCENTDGLRWPALAASRGRLRPSTLVQALPRDGNLSILSWDRGAVETQQSALTQPGLNQPPLTQPALIQPTHTQAHQQTQAAETSVGELAEGVFDAVISAAQQAFDLVIIDLPRHAPVQWAASCHHITVVTPARVRAAVAAAAVATRLRTVHSSVNIAVRVSGRAGLDPGLLASTVELDLAGSYRDDTHLAEQLDRGEGLTGKKTHVAKFAHELLGQVMHP